MSEAATAARWPSSRATGGIAAWLAARSRARQGRRRAITQRAVAEYERSGDCGAVAVIAGDGWHRGAIGLAASRIAEQLARPRGAAPPAGAPRRGAAGGGGGAGLSGVPPARIAEKLGRPCVVISLEGDLGHGSARSVETYHLLDGLTSCAELFETFGGHAQAAGLTIRRDQIPALRR